MSKSSIFTKSLLLSSFFFLPQIAVGSTFDVAVSTEVTFNVDASEAPLMSGNYGTQNYLASNPDCPLVLGDHSYGNQKIYPIADGSHDIETISATGGIDTFIALYSPTFNPDDPTENLLTCDDDGASSWPLSKITYDLVRDTSYVAIVTTWNANPVNGTISFQTTPDVGIFFTVSTQVDDAHGTISPALQDVLTGDTVSFTITPESGYSINTVTGCGGSLDGKVYTTGPIDENCTVVATFVERSFYYPMILPATLGKVN